LDPRHRTPTPRLGPRPSRALVVAALLAAASLAAPRAARADVVDVQTRATARKLGTEGMALYDQGDYAGALQKFTLANKLVPAPTLALRAARCLVRLGRLVEASEKYLEIQRTELDPKVLAVQRKAVAEAITEREKILPMIPTLVVAVQGERGDSLTVSVDGASVPIALLGERRAIDPGTHRVEVQRGSEPPIVRQVNVDAGEASRIDVPLPPLPPPPKPPPPPEVDPITKVIGRVGFAVAGAGLVVGVSHGIAALAQQSSLLERCGAARACPPDAAGAAGFYDATRAATTIGFVVAGVGAALSVPYFLKPKAETEGGASALRVTPWIGAGSAGLRGEF
jgi:hypothetical protein